MGDLPDIKPTNDIASMDEESLAKGFADAVHRAIEATHRAGRWTVHIFGQDIVRVYPDGRREIVGHVTPR